MGFKFGIKFQGPFGWIYFRKDGKKKYERKWFLQVFDWRAEKIENLVGLVFSLQTHQNVFSLNQGES